MRARLRQEATQPLAQQREHKSAHERGAAKDPLAAALSRGMSRIDGSDSVMRIGNPHAVFPFETADHPVERGRHAVQVNATASALSGAGGRRRVRHVPYIRLASARARQAGATLTASAGGTDLLTGYPQRDVVSLGRILAPLLWPFEKLSAHRCGRIGGRRTQDEVAPVIGKLFSTRA